MANIDIAEIKNGKGGPMLTAKKISLKDGQIVMVGNVLGTMPGQFYISALDLYKMYKMIDLSSFVGGVLKMFRQGKKEYKALLAEEAAKN